MLRFQTVFCVTAAAIVGAVAFVALAGSADAQSPPPPDPAIKYFTVTLPDTMLHYPSNLPSLADEHTTIIPPSSEHDFIPRPPGEDSYLFFASSSLTGGNSGAVVLETRDLVHFDFASTRGYAPQVMTAPIPFETCDATRLGEFDLNYAAPGSVVADPTRPGNMMMFYEAENHCPDGTDWQREFYATIGYARSFDFGRTWPAPINAIFGGKHRRPVLKLSTPEPTTLESSPAYMGNAIPSAFVDRDEHGNYYVYVTYIAPQGSAGTSDGLLRVARAALGGDDRFGDDRDDDNRDRKIQFTKWYNGSFSQPGIGGLDSGVLSARGCLGGVQGDPVISRNDDLGLYMLMYVCSPTIASPDGTFQGGWYYSTATSLELQDWTQPRLIVNSQSPIVKGCNPKDGSGKQFDGWYPSFMSQGAAAGHLKLSGKVFFMAGCDTGSRTFASRDFTIAKGP